MSNTLELAMRKACRLLYDRQSAFIFKVPEEMKQTPCDFFGFDRNGRAIMIECKQVKRTSLPIGSAPGLAPHQWVALDQADKCGAIALIVWQHGPHYRVYNVGAVWAMLRHTGKKSIKWEGCVYLTSPMALANSIWLAIELFSATPRK